MKRFQTLILVLLGLLVLWLPVPSCGRDDDAAPDALEALEAHASIAVAASAAVEERVDAG